MEYGDGIELPSKDVLEFSRAVSRFTERSFAMATPVQVTFVMDKTMFDHTYACTPDYGELWRTLCQELHVDANSPVAFKFHMDDVLLTNQNTVDMFKEAMRSATTTASVILTVTKHTDIGHSKQPRPRAQKRFCVWACPHALYLLCLLLLTAIMKARMSIQEGKIREDLATIDSLNSALVATKKQQARKIIELDGKIGSLTNEVSEGNKTAAVEALQWVEEKNQREAAIGNLTGTLKVLGLTSADTMYECTKEIYNLTSTVQDDNHLIRTQSEKIRHAPAAIAKLRGDLTAAEQDAGKIKECASKTGEIQGDFDQTDSRVHQLSLLRAMQVNKLKEDDADIDRLHKDVKTMMDNARPANGHYAWVCDGVIGFM